MIASVTQFRPIIGLSASCAAVGVPRATYYRRSRPKISKPRRSPPRTLDAGERETVLELLHAPRFADVAPAEVYATLLDEERYVCSERTMYRVLAENHEIRDRRNQLRHPKYAAPELLATPPVIEKVDILGQKLP